ncbi:hypothetical protein CAEBREN_32628 [Caenorhabditis brenneri]|uniref:SGNH hydrolase-type esterase domain-containing protein n=1 Tax=Caenorhabditis brenneri TaxID=135651 RepID=G0P8V2_CAEBE|nr:hypothetical protein CAEBREN_32628 [Caenorhabditis brenneri]
MAIPSCLLLFILTLSVTTSLASQPDLGYPGWQCDASLYQKSKKVPTSAHAVRFPDIKVIGALGDSLTAANGAGAPKGDPLAVILQYRGLAFQCGGDSTLDEHVTVANVLKKFSPNLMGYSTGIGSSNVWEISKLNQAVPGAQAADIVTQARALVHVMHSHSEIDIKNDWKLINVFIGANDMCRYCEEKENGIHSKANWKQNVTTAIQILKDNLPRTIVSMTGMFDMRMLRQIDHDKYFCDGLHVFECPCEKKSSFTNDDVSQACHLYMDAQQEIQDSGIFDTTDDFTFVLQPFFNDIVTPPLKPDGEVNLDWFAPDCFHFSRLGHANVAKHLWNNIVQPVGSKNHKVDLSDPTIPLNCPDVTCPFIRTTKNSADCSKYLSN